MHSTNLLAFLEVNEKAAKHALRYLNGTIDQGITFDGKLGIRLECWSVANWVGEEEPESVWGIVSPSPEAVTWYDEVAAEEEKQAQQRPRLPPSKFKLWSLDVSPAEAMESQPSGHFHGLEVSAQPAPHPIDDILDKSHRAFPFDQSLSRAKARQTHDLTPYLGLTERDNQFQILQEFMPRHLAAKWLCTVPADVRSEVLRVSRALGQEYRYYVLDRIVRGNYLTLESLALFERLERSMLALYAEKLRLEFGFYFRDFWNDLQYRVTLNLSRY